MLNALIMAFALLVAGSSGAKISCVSPVMISFWSRISCSSMAFFWAMLSKVTGVVVVLFHLSFTLVYILAPLVGGLMMSFALITCFHILLIVLLVLFRKKLIIDPTVKLIAELFLDN